MINTYASENSKSSCNCYWHACSHNWKCNHEFIMTGTMVHVIYFNAIFRTPAILNAYTHAHIHLHSHTLIHTHTHTQKQTRMQRFQHNMHSCKHYATIQGRSNDERRSTWSSQSAEFPWKRTRATVQLRENTTFSHNTLSECLGWTSDRHDLVPALYIQIKRGTLLIRKSMFYQRLPYPG